MYDYLENLYEPDYGRWQTNCYLPFLIKKSFAADRLFGIMELLTGGSPPTVLSLKGRTPRTPILLTIGIWGKSE